MADLELAVRQRQCLPQRFGVQATLAESVMVWADRCNTVRSAIDSHFTTADARIKLEGLYQTLEG